MKRKTVCIIGSSIATPIITGVILVLGIFLVVGINTLFPWPYVSSVINGRWDWVFRIVAIVL